MIAAKNHKNGVANPYAQMRKDFGFEFCRAESEKNPYVAGPLKRTDCSLVSDGAAALVLTDGETAKGMKKAVNFRATAHAQDFLPMSKRDILQFEGCTVAWQRALQKAGVTLNDLSFVETHDCFTVAELIEYEAMGLTPKGQGFRAVKEGWTLKDGKLPVNPSGGLKAKGHPIGATGVSMHVMTAMQLTGQAPEGMQLAKPETRRHLQHGRRGRRELRLDPRAREVVPWCCYAPRPLFANRLRPKADFGASRGFAGARCWGAEALAKAAGGASSTPWLHRKRRSLWNTGSSAFADDDSIWVHAARTTACTAPLPLTSASSNSAAAMARPNAARSSFAVSSVSSMPARAPGSSRALMKSSVMTSPRFA
jgi:hypothetical protein